MLTGVLGAWAQQSTLPAGSKQHPSYRSPDGLLWLGVPGNFYSFYPKAKVDSTFNLFKVRNLTAGSNIVLNKTDPNNWIISSTGGGSGSADWGVIGGDIENQTDLINILNSKVAINSNISLLNNNVGYIVGGTGLNEVRSNQALDDRYIQTEEDPSVASWIKNIAQSDITKWDNKLQDITGGTNVTIDRTNPLNPVINVSVPVVDTSLFVSKSGYQTVTGRKIFTGNQLFNGRIEMGGADMYIERQATGVVYFNSTSNNGYHFSIGGGVYNAGISNLGVYMTSNMGIKFGTIGGYLKSFGSGLNFDVATGVLTATGGGGGTQTYITAGTNITMTGSGTSGSPYVISANNGSQTVINGGSGVSVSGNGTSGSPYVITATGGGGGYVLPTASATVLGGIKIGSGLTIDGNGVVSVTGGGGGGPISLTGDVSGSGTSTVPTTIGNGAVTNAKLANMAANTIKGRVGTSGTPQDLSEYQLRQLTNKAHSLGGSTNINLENGSKQFLNTTGDITFTFSNFTSGMDGQVEVTNTSSSQIAINFDGGTFPEGQNSIIPAGKVAVFSFAKFQTAIRITKVIY